MKIKTKKAIVFTILLLSITPLFPISKKQAQTAFWQAVYNDNSKATKDAIKAGADVNAPDPELGTPALFFAIQKNNPTMVQLLIDKGIDVNKVDPNDGDTPLGRSIKLSRKTLTTKLLENGANTDITNVYDPTPISALQLAKNLAEKSPRNQRKNDIVKILSISSLPTVTEEQRQKFAQEQGGLDIITADDITNVPLDKLIILGKYLFLRKTIMDYMVSKLGSKEGIVDPFRNPIPNEIQLGLLAYFSLPPNLLSPEGPIYADANALQQRENWIIMTGEPETKKGKNKIKELEDEAAEYRKQIRNTLARYNYSYVE